MSVSISMACDMSVSLKVVDVHYIISISLWSRSSYLFVWYSVVCECALEREIVLERESASEGECASERVLQRECVLRRECVLLRECVLQRVCVQILSAFYRVC